MLEHNENDENYDLWNLFQKLKFMNQHPGTWCSQNLYHFCKFCFFRYSIRQKTPDEHLHVK